MGSRAIETDGRNLAVRTYPEVSRAIADYYTRRAWRRKRAGEDVRPGEMRGHSHAIGRVLCWLLTLSDDDQERIQEEGGAMLDRLHELPADYEGDFPFGRKAGSVFPEDSGEPPAGDRQESKRTR